jgi:hypothetical protein
MSCDRDPNANFWTYLSLIMALIIGAALWIVYLILHKS